MRQVGTIKAVHYTIELLTSVEAFEQGVAACQNTRMSFLNDTAFYNNSPAWVRLSWEMIEVSRGSRPFILLARDEIGRLAGWWPLLISKRSLGTRLQGFGQEYSDYCVPFIGQDHLSDQQTIIAGFIRFICQNRAAFSLAYFPALLLDPSAHTDPFPTLSRSCRGWLVEKSKENFLVDFKGVSDIEPLMTSIFSNKTRKQLRYEVNRMEKLGVLICQQLDGQGPLDEVEEFFRHNYQHGADLKKVDLWFRLFRAEIGKSAAVSVMRLDGQIQNVILYFARGTGVDFFSTVYNQDTARLSPGKVHLFLFIKKLCQQQRFHSLNFLAGDESYKQKWATRQFKTYQVFFHHRNSPVAALLSLKGLLKKIKRGQ
ncbi:MAG: GNAT family N-acetyltransferase [Magnetococcales bacterium]|nr:GNAT family N-acetyltransferase [Magnetococcales bacterium]